jgi:hypothetical protein
MNIRRLWPVPILTVLVGLGLSTGASASVPPIGTYSCSGQFDGHGTLKVKPDHRYKWIRDAGSDQTGSGKIKPKDGKRFVVKSGPLGPQDLAQPFKGDWGYINGTDHVVGISMARGAGSGSQYTCEEI